MKKHSQRPNAHESMEGVVVLVGGILIVPRIPPTPHLRVERLLTAYGEYSENILSPSQSSLGIVTAGIQTRVVSSPPG